MAYAFSRVNKALGGDEEQENQDIFAGTSQPGQQETGSEGQAGSSPQNLVKTSTANVIGGSVAPAASIQTPQEALAGGSAGASKILAGNKGTTPESVKGLGAKLAGASSSLQDEANQYVTGARQANYGASREDISDLVEGRDTAGSKKAAGLLSGSAAPQIEAFKPKTQTNFQEVGELGTEAGIANMIKRQGGARATKGELGLESALLRRDPGFQKIRSQLISQNAALTEQKNKILGESPEGATAQAKAAQAENYKRAQDELRASLGAQQAAIDAEIKDRVAKENAVRAALRRGDLSADPEYAAALAAARAQYGEADAGQYGSFAGDVTEADLYDEPSASRFSRISALLGKPGEVRVSGRGAGKRSQFDLGAYRSAAEKKSAAMAAAAAAEQKAKDDAAAAAAIEEQKAQAAAEAAQAGVPDTQAVKARDIVNTAMSPTNEVFRDMVNPLGPSAPARKVAEFDRSINPFTPVVDTAVDTFTGGTTKKIAQRFGLGKKR